MYDGAGAASAGDLEAGCAARANRASPPPLLSPRRTHARTHSLPCSFSAAALRGSPPPPSLALRSRSPFPTVVLLLTLSRSLPHADIRTHTLTHSHTRTRTCHLCSHTYPAPAYTYTYVHTGKMEGLCPLVSPRPHIGMLITKVEPSRRARGSTAAEQQRKGCRLRVRAAPGVPTFGYGPHTTSVEPGVRARATLDVLDVDYK